MRITYLDVTSVGVDSNSCCLYFGTDKIDDARCFLFRGSKTVRCFHADLPAEC